jgi:hypothetical protein
MFAGHHHPVSQLPPEFFLESYPAPMRAIANRLREIVRRAIPDVIEAVRPGWHLIGYDLPVDGRRRYFAYVAPEVEHVHLGFEHGVLMDDPDGLFQGVGITKQVRWLTFRPRDPVDDLLLMGLVREGARVAGLSRSERLARALDRDGRPIG